MCGSCSMHGKDAKCIQNVVGTSEEKKDHVRI
jgi:hypothetical protein